MDTSLRSFQDAFRSEAFRIKYRDNTGLYAFILITPSDKLAFQELVGSYEEIHWVTGKHISVVGPSITVENQRVPRERVAEAITTEFSQKYFSKFKQNQTKESYEFARFIGLPEDKLPCIVFFDTLLSPTEYVVWTIDLSRHELISSFRSLASHLSERCCWRDIDALRDLERSGSPKLRILESKLEGQRLRIKNRNDKLSNNIDMHEQQSLLDAIKLAEKRQIVLAKKVEAEKRIIDSLKENLNNKINKAIPPLDAIYSWNGALISRYSIIDNRGVWSSTIVAATDYRDNAIFKDSLKSEERVTMSRPQKNNPWSSGSYYLVAFVVIIFALSFVSTNVPWYALVLVVIATLLAISILGALQLRNDDRLKDESFLKLVIEFYKRLPLLKNENK